MKVKYTSQMEIAASEGDIEAVIYRFEVGRERCTSEGFIMAAENGYFEVVKYLYEHGVKSTCDSVDRAIENGHIEIVKYLTENGENEISETSFNIAAAKGYFEMIKYLSEIGVNGTIEAIEDAIENGNFDIVKFLYEEHEGKYSKNKKKLINIARRNGRNYIKQWLENQE